MNYQFETFYIEEKQFCKCLTCGSVVLQSDHMKHAAYHENLDSIHKYIRIVMDKFGLEPDKINSKKFL